MAFSPDGTRLATTGVGGQSKVRIWDPATGRQLAKLSHGIRIAVNVGVVVFSPDGTWLATGCQDGTARIWDPATGRQLAELSHGDKVVAAAFSPDGTRLATGSFGDGIVRIWDPATGQQLAKLSHGRLSYNGLAARLWRGPRVQAVAFSPDGTRLATGSDDHTARIWAL